jgi:hypothetical protein
MGFLLGAYGKLAAGARKRALQARQMQISSKVRRAARDVANMEKMIDRQQKSMEQQLTLQNTMAKQMYQTQMMSSMPAEYTTALANLQKEGISNEEKSAAAATVSQFQQTMSSQISQMSSYADTQLALNKQQIENQVEMMRDQMLEPLKDEEDSLQLELETIKSQLLVAEEDYKACVEMEKADAKNLAPNYTGGQG